MPFILESCWIVFGLLMIVWVRIELRRLQWNDGQQRAEEHFAPLLAALSDGQALAAAEQLTEILRKGTRHADVAYWLRACAWCALGRRALAEADVQSALALNLHLSGPYLLQARLYADEGAWAEAIDRLDYAIRLEPRDPEAYLLRALLNDATNCPERAREDRARAAELIGR